MSVIDQLVANGFGGYAGWRDQQSALNDFNATKGQGKETQQVPPGYQFQSQPQVMGASAQSPQNFMGQMGQNFQQGMGQAYDWATQKAQEAGNAFLPVASRITQQFGIKSPYDVFSGGVNTGTDFAVKTGTPVVLPSGRWRVVQSYDKAQGQGYIGNNENNGYGNSVMVQNLDTGERLRFSHLSKVGARTGDVLGGGVIGLSGATGNVTGPHLDLEFYDSKGKMGDVLKSPYMQNKMTAMGFHPPSAPKAVEGKPAPKAPKPQMTDILKTFTAPKSRLMTMNNTTQDVGVPQRGNRDMSASFYPSNQSPPDEIGVSDPEVRL